MAWLTLQAESVHSGCYTRPYFNVPGKIQSQYCVRHKTADMVNVVNQA